MLFKLFNKRKNWFTLIELLLVCSVFALLVSGVIIAINRAYSFMNDTKIRVRAANFAREGVEMVFNIRDTNWRRHSWERDSNRLCNGTENCTHKFGEWLYVLKEWTTDIWDKYFYVDKLSAFTTSDEYEKFYEDRAFRRYTGLYTWAEMQFDWDYNYMEYADGNRVPQVWSIQDLLFNEVDFYRIVRVFGIYKKNTEGSSILATVDELKNGTPVEMRFCVKVFYRNGSRNGSSELCSVMTNFME